MSKVLYIMMYGVLKQIENHAMTNINSLVPTGQLVDYLITI